MKNITNIFITDASASPGSGHSHGPEVSGTTQMIGVGIIVLVSNQERYY